MSSIENSGSRTVLDESVSNREVNIYNLLNDVILEKIFSDTYT
jgi:hypothetical protein